MKARHPYHFHSDHPLLGQLPQIGMLPQNVVIILALRIRDRLDLRI